MKSEAKFMDALNKIAARKGLTIDNEAFNAVIENKRICLCNLTKNCPCSEITDDGCPCGLFLPNDL